MRSVVITKKSVTRSQGGLFNITLNMQYLDGEDILIDDDFSEHYATGENQGGVVTKFKTRMQEAIDDYKASETIFNSAAIDTAVITLQNDLEI